MADISVTCSGCGAGIQVSEFADSVVCRSCGRSTPVPKAVAPAPVAGAEVQPGAGSGLRFKSGRRTQPKGQAGVDLRDVVGHVKKRATRERTGFSWGGSTALAWVAFLVVGGLAVWARFGALLSPEHLDLLKRYGPMLALAFHIMVVVRAFEDSVLQGAMCVLLPPYAFYYLFAFCDLFVLRGLYLGVLAGVGLDTFVVVRELAIAVNRSVTTWIMSGG
jgi:hypothetical protein